MASFSPAAVALVGCVRALEWHGLGLSLRLANLRGGLDEAGGKGSGSGLWKLEPGAIE